MSAEVENKKQHRFDHVEHRPSDGEVGGDDRTIIGDNEPGGRKHRVDDVMTGQVRAMALEDRQAALELAQSIDPGPPLWSWRYMQFVLTGIVICMVSGDNGFDGTVMSSINSMTQFQEYFGLSSEATSGTGIIFGMITIGNVVSFFPGSYLPDKIGRRWTMFIGNIVLIVGALLAGLARNEGMLLGGRFLTGLGGGTANNASKPYLAEITTAANRGRWVGLLNTCYYFGQILATGIAIPFGYGTSNWGWRAPILIQAAPAVINVAFVLFLPESPRWLYANGQKEKATQILADLHSANRDPNSPLIQLEIQEIETHLSLSGADKRFWDFRQLFNTPGNRYRFWIVTIVSVQGQLSGNGLITYYLPVLLRNAGIVNTDRQRVLNLVNSVTSCIGALCGTAVVDHVGRRPLLLFSSIACTIGMAIVAGLLSDGGNGSIERANAGITFIFLFMVFFSFGWTPLQAVYPTEVLSFENRAKGLALGGWESSAVSCINTFALPTALEMIAWKTYIIFMAWDAIWVVIIWFSAVETKRLSLEDLDDVFNSSHPRQLSLKLARDAKVAAKKEKEAAV